ncbi:MAG TPA: tetratricopeptide repeat protein [Planktothrix sp.]|jgi:tetratricopeptide (TPR) repeat protein
MLNRRFFSASLAASVFLTINVRAALADAQAWQQYTKDGTEALQLAQYGPAERSFKLALKEAEAFGPRDVRLAKSLINLGLVYKAHGPLQKAGPLLERAVAIEQSALGPTNFEVVSGVAKLCEYYIQTGDITKADRLCARVVTYAQKVTAERKSVGNAFKSLSDFYASHRDLEEAEIMVKQAEELTHKQAANGDLDLAVVLDSLGTTYNNRPQAEPLFCMALAIRASSLPPTHMALASSCESLAKLYVAEGKADEAEPLYRQAFEISVRAVGAHKPETLDRADGYAQCLVREGKLSEAEHVLRTTMDSCEEAYGKSSGHTSRFQLALATLYSREGRYSEASPLYAQALKTSEAMNGPQNAALCPILEAYADALDKTNKHGEANKMHNRSRAIRM